jgi:hypothetical protein
MLHSSALNRGRVCAQCDEASACNVRFQATHRTPRLHNGPLKRSAIVFLGVETAFFFVAFNRPIFRRGARVCLGRG